MQITAVVNQKGGVGKTTTTVNLGAALAGMGRRVLLIDFDPQGDLTKALGLRVPPGTATLATALTGEWSGDPAALIVMHDGAGGRLAAIPRTLEMLTVVRKLDQLRAREERLARLLATLDGVFDHCLIDCSPALDILTDNALTAADGVLIPVQAEDSSLDAVGLLLGQIGALEAELRRDKLILHGLVVSMLERGKGGVARSLLARSVIDSLALLPLPILATVPRSVGLAEAWRHGRAIADYAPESEHAQVYRDLAERIDA